MRILILTFLVLTGVPYGPVRAAESEPFCVICTGPLKTYRCVVIEPVDGVMTQSPQIFCASEVALRNGHASCAVQRSAVAACQGEPVTVAYTGPVRPADEAVATDDAGVTTPEPQGPPKTLIEATDRAVKNSGEQIKKAGKAVGSVAKKTGEVVSDAAKTTGKTIGQAAKSTFNCIVSLFTACN